MSIRCVYRIVLFLLLLTSALHAQYSNLKFENFDTTEGLSSSSCVEIFQDSEGFLWFGTNDGLNKYDGYNFKVYRPIINDVNSISNNRINSIVEDSQGNLWVGTDDGLNVLDKRTETFFRIILYEDTLIKDVVNSLFFDEIKNHLWVGTNNGASKIILNNSLKNYKSDLIVEHYQNIKDNEASISQNNITNILKDKEGNIWLVSNDDYLNKYNSEKNKFERTLIDIPSPKNLDHLPKSVILDHDGDFWIGNNLSYLLHWDRKVNRFESISLVDKDISIFNLYQDSKGVIWIATDGDGLYTLDKKTKKIQHILHNPLDPFSLPNNQPSKVLEDKEGVFWIASYNKGISKLVLSKSLFGHYFYQLNKSNGLSGRIAQAVLEDKNKRIWIGTGTGGLNLFNEKDNTFVYFRSNVNDSETISSDKILSLSESYNGNLWVGTWDGGLNKFNPKTKKVERFLNDPNDSLSLGQNTVWTSIEDSKKRLWVGTSTSGLNLFDPISKKFYRYKNLPMVINTIPSNFVFSLFIDTQDRLFVGTSLGLSFIDLKTLDSYIPRNIDFQQVSKKNIQNTRINFITEDHYNNIWVGTDFGLYKLDSNLELLETYTNKDGLPNNVVIGIVEDDNYKIWITTKGGVSMLDPIKSIFTNYNSNHGLQGLEYQSKSIDKTHDGRLIMGGINGFNLFDPVEVFQTQSFVKPIITNFKLFNKTVNIGDTINGRVLFEKSITETKNFTLNYNEGFMTFEFLALNYKNSQQTNYAYKLHGLESDYTSSGYNRSVNYSNLLPGKYIFEVKASLDRQWENAMSSKIKFEVLPPPWKTWWAYLIYLICGTLLFLILTNYYTKKVQKAQQYELDQMNLQFFINVSHEFRTPLTLILNPVNKILSGFNNDSETIKASAVTIQRSARRLMHLVNQLLDYRKMDVGMAPLRLEKGDAVKFSKDIFSLFKGLAAKKEINYTFKATNKTITSLFDFDKLEKIITNLISNAIKFTNNGGEIKVSVKKIQAKKKTSNFLFFKKEKLNNYLEIVVEDSGVGLDKEQSKQIFSRFYNLDVTKSGTGIGLNFTKGLVEQHGGEIFVKSQHQKGCKFFVRLPLDIKAEPEKVENVKNEFLINSMKAVEYEMLISNNDQSLDNENDEKSKNDKRKLPTVLIVEDNKELRIHLKNDLKDTYVVKEAVNGEEGLKMVKKYFPDIVISDVMMPKMDGFEMCKLIKTDLETCHIPVILLTARTLEDDRITGYNNGADGYLSKPFITSVLRSRVNNLLESKKRLRQKFKETGGVFPSSEIVSNNIDEAFLDKTTKIVLDNINNTDFKLEDLLKAMSLGRSQFYRKINSLTGLNPSSFIRTVKLRYASELLLKNEYSIKEVSFMSGFNSTTYFGKTFKELFELSPREFIDKNNSDSN